MIAHFVFRFTLKSVAKRTYVWRISKSASLPGTDGTFKPVTWYVVLCYNDIGLELLVVQCKVKSNISIIFVGSLKCSM